MSKPIDRIKNTLKDNLSVRGDKIDVTKAANACEQIIITRQIKLLLKSQIKLNQEISKVEKSDELQQILIRIEGYKKAIEFLNNEISELRKELK